MFALIIVGLIFFTFILFFVGLVYQGQQVRKRRELFAVQNPTPEQLVAQEQIAFEWLLQGNAINVVGEKKQTNFFIFPEVSDRVESATRRILMAKQFVAPVVRFELWDKDGGVIH